MMKREMFFLATFFAVLTLTLAPGHCAEQVQKPDAPGAGKEASPEGSPAKPAQGDAAGGQNIEKLLYTLNETLEENRKIRQSMRDLQSAFEKVAIEKSDLEVRMKRVENQAEQRVKAAGAQVGELKKEVDASKTEIDRLLSEQKSASAVKRDVEDRLHAADQENAHLKDVLKGAVLQAERDQVMERIRKNNEEVDNAVLIVAGTQAENRELREQLVRSYFDLGNTFYGLGRYEEAVAQYRNVLLWNPNHAEANHNLGIIYDYHFKKLHEARYFYQNYLNLKSPGEAANEVRIRLFELNQLAKLEPVYPLKKDFKEMFESRTEG